MVQNYMKISKVSEMDVENSRYLEFLDENFHMCQKLKFSKFPELFQLHISIKNYQF